MLLRSFCPRLTSESPWTIGSDTILLSADRDIVRLVASLTTAEKRYFKRQFTSGSTNYVRLFENILQKGQNLDQQTEGATQYFLYRKLLRSLRLQYEGKSVLSRITCRLCEAEILYAKRLYPAAAYILQQARRLALEHHRLTLLPEIMHWEVRLQPHLGPRPVEEKSAPNLTAITQETRLSYVLGQVLDLQSRQYKMSLPELKAAVEPWLGEVEHLAKESGRLASYYRFCILIRCCEISGDLEGASAAARRGAAWAGAAEGLVEHYPELYQNLVADDLRLRLVCQKSFAPESSLRPLLTLSNRRDAPQPKPDGRVELLWRAWEVVFEQPYPSADDFSSIAPDRAALGTDWQEFAERLEVLREISRANFLLAQKRLTAMLDRLPVRSLHPHSIQVRLLLLICYYESGAPSLFDSMYRSLIRKLSPRRQFWPYEMLLLNYLAKLNQEIYARDAVQVSRKFRKKFAMLEQAAGTRPKGLLLIAQERWRDRKLKPGHEISQSLNWS